MEQDRHDRRPVPEPRRDFVKMPRKLDLTIIARAVPGLFSEWNGLDFAVPEEFVSHDADEEGRPLAVVACPCGESPVVPLAGLRACNCRRVFANVGHDQVRVYKPPMTDEEYADDPEFAPTP